MIGGWWSIPLSRAQGALRDHDGLAIQHTPVVPNDSIHRDHSHDLVTELAEKFPLERFSEAVRNHFFGRAALNCNFLSGDAISNKEAPNVDMACSLVA
jgi:hypothetical protein